MNTLIAELLILIGTEHVTSIAYSHEENAIIERSHKETMRHLRALVFDRLLQDRWSLCLPLVQRIHNSKVHEATGLSPARILFGDTVNLDINIFVPEEIGQFSSGEPKELSVYMRKLLDSQERLLELARERIQLRDENNSKRRRNRTVTEFEPGSKVLICGEGSVTAKRNKLNTPNAGPYQVISHEGNEYTLRDTTQNMELKVHVSKLIPYFEDANKTDSVDIARKDAAELVVKAILDHQP